MIFPEPIVDLVEPGGAYGGDPFARGGSTFAEKYPHQVQNFAVSSALDGPQVSATWDAPAEPIARLRILRKLQEYPRDETDGTLVLETSNPLTNQLVDRGSTLTGAALGDTQWWYYRAFTLPSELAIADQFAGRGFQKLAAAQSSIPIDVQRFPNYTIRTLDTGGGGNVELFTAPTRDGPWVSVTTWALALDETKETPISDVSHKYIKVTPDAAADVWLVTNRQTLWQTSMNASRACLAYRSGYHMDAIWNGNLIPDQWRSLDDNEERIDRMILVEGTLANNEVANQNEPLGQFRGPLFRFLKILSLEFDRTRAHVDALRKFAVDIDHAPEHVLQHIAFTLGWSVDLSRPLLEVRDELLRQALFWKHKGTSRLLVSVAAQILGITPRAQEGPGLVQRSLDPALLHGQQHAPQFDGGIQ